MRRHTTETPRHGECARSSRPVAVTLNVKNDALTVSLDDYTRIYAFDSAGRMITAFVEGRNYRRGLDNRFVVKVPAEANRNTGTSVRRQELAGERRVAFIRELVQDARRALSAFRAGEAELVGRRRNPGVTSNLLAEWLQRISSWGTGSYALETERFLDVYKPITILPPDQYVSLVVQVAEGCSWNRCTFCDFYRTRGFHIKLGAELRQHIAQVKRFAGPSMSWHKNIFLADANALVIPQRELVEIMDVLNEEFAYIPDDLRGPERWEFQRQHPWPFEGLFSFMDVFGMRKKTVDDFRELVARHLKRVYIGLETGDDKLLQFLNKRGFAAQAVESVHHIKEAGANVGVIIMAGVGGVQWEKGHIERTVEVVRAMNLGAGDIVYLSPFVQHEGGEYAERARQAGLFAATPDDIRRQLRVLKQRLSGVASEHKVSMYDIRDFIY